MSQVTLEEVKSSAENAMKAFEVLKNDKDMLGKKFEDMSADNQAKFKALEKTIGEAAELSQKKAAEDAAKLKAVEDELNQVKTAFNRLPAAEQADPKAQLKKLNKHFNDFAKSGKGANKEYFDEYLDRTVKDETERKALSVYSDPDGGYTVLAEQGGMIQTKVFESSPMRQLASVITIGTDMWEVITDNGEASTGWVGEVATRSETNTPTLGKISIPVHEIYAQPYASQKIIDDSTVDIESWLGEKVARDFARAQNTAFVTGDGVNKPRGIMSYTAGTDIALGQIQQVNSGSATDFTYTGLVNLQTALKEPYQSNATFLVKRSSMANLMLLMDGNDRPIFNPGFDKNTGLETMLMGRPLRFADDIAGVSGSALAILYGDIREAYQIVDRIGIRILRDPYTSKPHIKFYTTARVGGAVKNFEAVKIGKIAS